MIALLPFICPIRHLSRGVGTFILPSALRHLLGQNKGNGENRTALGRTASGEYVHTPPLSVWFGEALLLLPRSY